MRFYVRPLRAILFILTVAAASGQQPKPSSDLPPGVPAPIVQPGAPGKSSKVLTSEQARVPLHPPSAADIAFMQGMIMHHSQAVEMTALLSQQGASPALQELGKRMKISQSDEMEYMKQWLAQRGQPDTVPMSHNMAGMDMKNMDMKNMKGMDHSSMQPMTMPGMLTPEQMQALRQARGPALDYLFLTGMIQHHTGALVMVQDLFDTPGAGQDAVLFDFATDVDNTQRAEINVMQGMLLKEKQ
ncbi:MAG TPA: DUF305 domain-containing protein [Bryobacteraceae bacterium]|jgi:uncharacterized protein (DUF305 family)|nr:DUF305 domain-containing protein [Bryobacteraceae bacterium]